ncbi:MAG: hypothetical protein IJA69_05505, partial [Clostridia bacterium]|nr:hypothetical protein [Clostridia bacterium]
ITNFINNINLNINNLKMSTKNLCIKLSVAQQKVVESKQNRLDILLNKLNKLNPEEILKLGYATLKKQDGYIKSVDNIEIGQNIDILLKDGLLSAVVNNKEKK